MPARSAHHLPAPLLLAVLVCCLGCTGCTLVGMGIGSTVPTYDRTSNLADSPRGTLVKIRMEDGSRIDGVVESQPNPLVVRDSDTGKRVTLDPAANWTAERQVGSEWLAGAVFGAIADAAVVVALVIAAPHHNLGCYLYCTQ